MTVDTQNFAKYLEYNTGHSYQHDDKQSDHESDVILKIRIILLSSYDVTMEVAIF